MKRLVPVVTVRAAIHLHDPVVTVAQVDPLCHRLFAKKKRAVCRRTAARLQGPKEPPGVTPLGWSGVTSRAIATLAATCKLRVPLPDSCAGTRGNAGAVEIRTLEVQLDAKLQLPSRT